MEGLKVNIKKKLLKYSLDISLQAGRIATGIFGPSGGGKTMLLKHIAGIEKPQEGEISLGDKILFSKEKSINLSPGKRRVGMLFQNYALFSNMTIGENILSVMPKGSKLPESLMTLFHIEELSGRYPHQLSGGQKQRAALARMIARDNEIYLLDEPFSSLDSFMVSTLEEELMGSLKDRGKPMLYVSHNLTEIYRYCSHIVIMKDGVILEEGPCIDVGNRPSYLESAKLLGMKNFLRLDSSLENLSNWNLNALEYKKIKEGIKESIKVGIKDNIEETPMTLGIYPHDVMINHPESTIQGLVTSVTATPGIHLLEIEIRPGTFIHVSSQEEYQKGSRVRLWMPPEKIRPLADKKELTHGI